MPRNRMPLRPLVPGLLCLALATAACSSAGGSPAATPATAPTSIASSALLTSPSTLPAAPGTPAASTPWTRILSLSPTHSIYTAGFLDASYGITVGYSGEVHTTIDGGKTWPQSENQTQCRFGLDIVDANVAWHCGNGQPASTSDGGKTWTAYDTMSTHEPSQCRFLSFLDGKTGWAATADDLEATADGAGHWTNIPLPAGFKGPIAALHLRTAADGFVLDEAGTLWATPDGGKTWSSSSLGLPTGEKIGTGGKAMAAMRFSSAMSGVVVASMATDGRVVEMRTADAGRTWTSEVIPLDGLLADAMFLAPDGRTLTITTAGTGITVLQRQA